MNITLEEWNLWQERSIGSGWWQDILGYWLPVFALSIILLSIIVLKGFFLHYLTVHAHLDRPVNLHILIEQVNILKAKSFPIVSLFIVSVRFSYLESTPSTMVQFYSPSRLQSRMRSSLDIRAATFS